VWTIISRALFSVLPGIQDILKGWSVDFIISLLLAIAYKVGSPEKYKGKPVFG